MGKYVPWDVGVRRKNTEPKVIVSRSLGREGHLTWHMGSRRSFKFCPAAKKGERRRAVVHRVLTVCAYKRGVCGEKMRTINQTYLHYLIPYW